MGHLLSSAIKMSASSGIPTGVFSVSFSEVPSLTGGLLPLKNGSAYLTRITTGSSSGTITTGDTFSVSLTSPDIAYRYVILESTLRGVLFLGELESGMAGPISSPTFTKVDNENISINAIADAS
jgi:hypothetical protein